MEDAPTPPPVNTYDVWSRKDSAPARNSYTPPPLEEGTAPRPAPWNRAYLLSQDIPQYVAPTLDTYNVWGRKDGPPARESYTPPSGQKPPVWYPAYSQGRGITKEELEKLILNDQDRTEKSYDYNGVANKASPNYRALSQFYKEGDWIDRLSSFSHHNGGWVDKAKIDERVEDFVNREVHEGLDKNWPRDEAAMKNNGHASTWPAAAAIPESDSASLYQTHHRYHNFNNDIAEHQIDEEVHGFANPNTETLNWARSEDPFIMNGSKNPSSGYGYTDPDTAASLFQNRNRFGYRDMSEK